MYDTIEIRKKLEKNLDSYRFNHTLGVAYTATSLAMRYNYDLKKAEVAGLLHDCAKNLSHKKKISLCQKYNIPISDVEWIYPDLLHAKAGVLVAQEVYGVYDEEILRSIHYHTTGCPNMSLLDKIIYISDYIEPARKETSGLNEIRSLAFIDIDVCLLKILKDTVEHIEEANKVFDPVTKETYQYYYQQLSKAVL